MEATLKKYKKTRIILADILAITAVYLIPSIAHFSPFPLYFAEPMRLIAITVYFLSKNHWNAMVLAFTLPFFSMLFTGHPIPLKAILISVELFLNILFLRIMTKNLNLHLLLALFSSILFSKILYYFLKYALLTTSLMSGSLISIPIYIQLFSSAITAILFFVFLYNKEKL
ncbi:MAG: hypothetical protein ACXIUQ_11370 [Cecembia sp.]